MSRVAMPSEKIMATAGIYRALRSELGIEGLVIGEITAALIDASVRIAMATDTKDMGIIGMQHKRDESLAQGDHFRYPHDRPDEEAEPGWPPQGS